MVQFNVRGLSRGPYALMVLPLFAVSFTPLVAWVGPWILARIGFDLSNFAAPMIAIQLFCYALVIPMAAIVVARLRHASLSPWLVVPLILAVPAKLGLGWLTVRLVNSTATDMAGFTMVMMWLVAACSLYGLVLVLTLTVWPEKKVPLPA